MTVMGYGANICIGGTAICNGFYASGYEASSAFDGNTTATMWQSAQASGQNLVSWIGYNFGTGIQKQIKKITIMQGYNVATSSFSINNCVSSVLVEYSNDGVSWNTLTSSALSLTTGFQYINLSDSGTYQYWRLRANSNTQNTGSCWLVDEVQMMEKIQISSGDVVSSLTNMQVGDFIPCRYSASSNVAGGFSEFGTCTASEIPVTGTVTPDGLFNFVKVDKGLCIADRVIQTGVSWNVLNTVKFIEGCEFNIKYPNSKITAFGDGTAYGTTSPAKLFDGILVNDGSNGGYQVTNFIDTLKIGGILGSPQKLYKIRYYTYSAAYQPSLFTIEASNDTTTGLDGNWTVLKSYSGYPAIGGNVWGELIINSDVAYKAYRYNITTTDGRKYFVMNELEFILSMDIKGFVRSLSGGNSYSDVNGNSSTVNLGLGAFPPNNEWDKYITNSNLKGKITAGDNNVWHYNESISWCQETPISGTYTSSSGSTATNVTSAWRILRGSNGVWGDFGFTPSNNPYGFRPVLTYKE